MALSFEALTAVVRAETEARPALGFEVRIPLSAATIAALTRALREADQRGHAWVSTGHVLLGIHGDPDSLASKMLAGHGVTYATVSRDDGALGADA